MGKLPAFWRLAIGGFFMGLANLVPGVSGGTMILALGLYDFFIEGFSDLTRFKFSKKAFIIVGTLFGIAILTIIIMSGIIQYMMESFRPEMLGLFIGLTLGGAPMLFKMIRPLNGKTIISALLGFLLMVVVAFFLKPGGGYLSWGFLFMGGVIGSSAMILPGISGSYLLLVLGIYLPIISAINDAKHAIKLQNFDALFTLGLDIIFPFALGILVGIIALSNVLKFLLTKHDKVTNGFLLGFLLGSVLGLYPFKAPSFDKLIRYAVPASTQGVELKIMARGWQSSDDSEIFQALKKLQSDRIKLRIVDQTDNAPSVKDVQYARVSSSVIISYDKDVVRQVRESAGDKRIGKVPLIIVPDSRFSWSRGITIFFLLILGCLTTFLFGRKKS